MIYFLVNNNYHLELDNKLVGQLNNSILGLIQVPYSLKIIETSNVYSRIYCFNERIDPSLKKLIFYPFKLNKILKSIHETIKPVISDILLVHTDLDLTNQYIIHIFYSVGAKIYILEDGTATMCSYNIVSKPAPLKDRLKSIILRYFYHIKKQRIRRFGKEILPIMYDEIFSGVIVNFGNSIKRNIPCYRLAPIEEKLPITYPNGAIFFNQAVYYWFMTDNQYIEYLRKLLAISKCFSPFFFKFHPSDTPFVKEAITKFINEVHTEIVIIGDNEIAERIIYKYSTKYAISFNSTALLNLINLGVVPIFLNNIFKKTFCDDSFDAFERFLGAIKCNAPVNIDEVKVGFVAFSEAKEIDRTYSLNEILF